MGLEMERSVNRLQLDQFLGICGDFLFLFFFFNFQLASSFFLWLYGRITKTLNLDEFNEYHVVYVVRKDVFHG